MADTLDRSTRAAGTSPFLWVLVLVVLAVVVLWALGAWGANEAVDDPPSGGQPIGSIEPFEPGPAPSVVTASDAAG